MVIGIGIGQIYCDGCKDPFFPEGIGYESEPNFCSDECEEDFEEQQAEQLDLQAYNEGRYGGAPVHE